MNYIVDENKDEKRERPQGLEGAGPEMLSYLGGDLWILEMRSWPNIPAWQKFFDTCKADAKQVKRMIKECATMPEEVARVGYANALREAVPPIYIAAD